MRDALIQRIERFGHTVIESSMTSISNSSRMTTINEDDTDDSEVVEQLCVRKRRGPPVPALDVPDESDNDTVVSSSGRLCKRNKRYFL